MKISVSIDTSNTKQIVYLQNQFNNLNNDMKATIKKLNQQPQISKWEEELVLGTATILLNAKKKISMLTGMIKNNKTA